MFSTAAYGMKLADCKVHELLNRVATNIPAQPVFIILRKTPPKIMNCDIGMAQ